MSAIMYQIAWEMGEINIWKKDFLDDQNNLNCSFYAKKSKSVSCIFLCEQIRSLRSKTVSFLRENPINGQSFNNNDICWSLGW